MLQIKKPYYNKVERDVKMKSHISTTATQAESDRIKAIQKNAEEYFNNHLLVNDQGRSRSDEYTMDENFVKEQEKRFGPMIKSSTGIMVPENVADPNVRDAFLDSIIANPNSIKPISRETESWDLSLFPPYNPNISGQGKGMTEDEYICWCVDQLDTPQVDAEGNVGVSLRHELHMQKKLAEEAAMWENNPNDSSRFESEYDPGEEEGLVSYSNLPKDTKDEIAKGDAGIHPDTAVLARQAEAKAAEAEDSFGLESTMFQPSASTNTVPSFGGPQFYNYNYGRPTYSYGNYNYNYGGYPQYGYPYYGGYFNPNYSWYQKQQDDYKRLLCMTGHAFHIPQDIPPYIRRDYSKNANSQFTKIEKDGKMYWIRTISPYFSVIPDGNEYATAFMSVYQYPDHPQYKTIRDLYEAAEFDYIRSQKYVASLFREDKETESFQSFLEKEYNPYSFENAVPVYEETVATDGVKYEAPKRRQIFIVNMEEDGSCDVVLESKIDPEQAKIDLAERQQMLRERLNKAYQQAFEIANMRNAMARVVQEVYYYFPEFKENFDLTSEKGAEIMARYEEHFIYEPQRRRERFNHMYERFDMNMWLSDKKEDILRKNDIWQRNMAAIKAEMGIVETEEDLKEREIDKQAYDIASKYHSQELVPNKPTFNIPLYELEKLPREVLIRLGLDNVFRNAY